MYVNQRIKFCGKDLIDQLYFYIITCGFKQVIQIDTILLVGLLVEYARFIDSNIPSDEKTYSDIKMDFRNIDRKVRNRPSEL